MNSVFLHNSLIYRIVWRGVTRCRLQDNRGRNYIMTYEEIVNIHSND